MEIQSLQQLHLQSLSTASFSTGKLPSYASTLISTSSCTNPLVLPQGFKPRDIDILCGRGRGAWEHPGNRRFKALIEAHVEEYSMARTKIDKSVVVASMVDLMREQGILFVKKSTETQLWYDIGEYQAREKTGHAIRDHIFKTHCATRKNGKQSTRKSEIKSKKEKYQKKTKQQPTIVCGSPMQQTTPNQQESSSHPVLSSSSSSNLLLLNDVSSDAKNSRGLSLDSVSSQILLQIAQGIDAPSVVGNDPVIPSSPFDNPFLSTETSSDTMNPKGLCVDFISRNNKFHSSQCIDGSTVFANDVFIRDSYPKLTIEHEQEKMEAMSLEIPDVTSCTLMEESPQHVQQHQTQHNNHHQFPSSLSSNCPNLRSGHSVETMTLKGDSDTSILSQDIFHHLQRLNNIPVAADDGWKESKCQHVVIPERVTIRQGNSRDTQTIHTFKASGLVAEEDELFRWSELFPVEAFD